jgi:exodeoxyribonuclease-3
MTASRQQSLFSPDAKQNAVVMKDRVGVLTWNVQHAAPQRAWRQVNWLASCPSADVLVLTEVSQSSAAHTLVAALTEHGYDFHLPEVLDGPDYRVAVAARIGPVKGLDLQLPYLPHRCVIAHVGDLSATPLVVIGLYVPSRGPQDRRNEAKRAFQEAVTTFLPTAVDQLPSDARVLVAGDLNIVEPGHRPHHAVFRAWEYDFYRSIGAAGFIDCFRHVYPDANDHSWYGRSGAGYRFDHVFITDRHVSDVMDCRYLHDARTQGLSDHAAMAVTLRQSAEHSRWRTDTGP